MVLWFYEKADTWLCNLFNYLVHEHKYWRFNISRTCAYWSTICSCSLFEFCGNAEKRHDSNFTPHWAVSVPLEKTMCSLTAKGVLLWFEVLNRHFYLLLFKTDGDSGTVILRGTLVFRKYSKESKLFSVCLRVQAYISVLRRIVEPQEMFSIHPFTVSLEKSYALVICIVLTGS